MVSYVMDCLTCLRVSWSALLPTSTKVGVRGSILRRASIIQVGMCSNEARWQMSNTSTTPTELR